jgi:hypothetical protein
VHRLHLMTIGLVVLTFGGRIEAQKAPPLMSVEVVNGRMTCDIRDAPLVEVLEAIGARTRVTLVPGAALAAERVSLQLTAVPLDEGLRRLLAGYDTFLYYGADTSGRSSLQAVWVYQRGTGSAARPVPPEQWAGSAELRERSRSGDDGTREQAYMALLSRPDAESRTVVLDALRGSTENNAGLRERLLSAAMQQGMDVPRELLTDVARTDPSEMVRVIALEALAGDPTAREVAGGLLDDPSPLVQQRARDIMAETQATSRAAQPVPPW